MLRVLDDDLDVLKSCLEWSISDLSKAFEGESKLTPGTMPYDVIADAVEQRKRLLSSVREEMVVVAKKKLRQNDR